MSFSKVLSSGFVSLLVATPVYAQKPDAVCAVEQIIACEAFKPCERTLPGGLNMPALIKIDHEAGVVVSLASEAGDRTSPIKDVEELEDGYAIHGVDRGHLWSIVYNTETSRFTFASPRQDIGFMGFGVCASKILD